MTRQSTQDLLTRELTSSLKINSRIRRLLNRRLDFVSKQLKTPTLNEDKVPKLVKELIEILEASGTTTDRTSKLLLGPKAPPPEPNPTSEDILREMLHGRTTKK
jgi:hypothetical protein